MVRQKAEPVPRFLSVTCRLLPVTLDQDILAMAMDPMVGDPALTPMGRLLVVTGRPDIMVGVVAMIAGLPYISLPGRCATPFMHWRGWPDADHNLRERRRRDQGKCEQECQCDFLHENRVLQGLGACG